MPVMEQLYICTQSRTLHTTQQSKRQPGFTDLFDLTQLSATKGVLIENNQQKFI